MKRKGVQYFETYSSRSFLKMVFLKDMARLQHLIESLLLGVSQRRVCFEFLELPMVFLLVSL